LNYEVFECIMREPLPIHMIELYHVCEGKLLKQKVFRGWK